MSTRPNKDKPRLGRGLPAIFGDNPVASAASGDSTAPAATQIEGYFLCEMTLIDPMPRQPRQRFSDEGIAELSESIRVHGLLQPLVVRVGSNGRYRLVAGERRFRACKKLELTRVPVVVRDTDDVGEFELALIENLLREDLDPIEEAVSFQRLVEEHAYTHKMLADRLQRSRAAISNAMRLLQLSDRVKQMLQAGDLSVGHARALITLPHAAQDVLSQRALTDRLTVRDLEELARKVGDGADPAGVRLDAVIEAETAAAAIAALEEAIAVATAVPDPEPAAESSVAATRPTRTPPRPLRPQLASVQRKLQEHLSARVRIHEHKGGGGSIEIEYASNSALQAILDTIFNDR